jgi:outer membrane protein TolC
VTPRAEIVQLEADLASREASRIAGEQQLFQARQDLGREIGLEPPRIAALALPGDRFPAVDPERVPSTEASGPWIDRALANRLDLRAARQRLAAAEIRLAAAENGVEPRLDIVFTPSYSGLAEGSSFTSFFSPLFDEVPGLSGSLGLSLRWPLRNRVAEGALVQARAEVTQRSLAVEAVRKAIGAEVPSRLDAVRQNALQLVKIDQAVSYFERALDNEIKKLRAGSSTLVDVISQRDRLTAIRRQQVSGGLAVALALLELRFETGTLTVSGGEKSSIPLQPLTTLPD